MKWSLPRVEEFYIDKMASDTQLATFSLDGRYLAFCGADGRLKVWETTTGLLKQEYTPSSHLTASCTCLSWMPNYSTSVS